MGPDNTLPIALPLALGTYVRGESPLGQAWNPPTPPIPPTPC